MKLNVVIIGAGLAGLALGQSLKNNDINFLIYERDKALDSRPQGYRIRIDVEGQKALKACLSEDTYNLFVNSCSQSNDEVKLFDEKMNRIVQPNVEAWDITDNLSRDLRPNRNTLREVLCKGIEEHIVFDKNLKEYHSLENQGVQLLFEDGKEIIANVVVFADGVNSTAGSILFNDKKINTQNICMYGKADITDKVLTQVNQGLQDGTSVIVTNQMSLIVDSMKFSNCTETFKDNKLTRVEDYLYWSLVGSCQAFGLTPQTYYTLTQDEINKLVLDKLKGWDTSITALMRNTGAETLSLNAIRTSNVKRDWQHSAITVMGDAIHAMTPAGGMGANTAFKDAIALSNCLQDVRTENISIANALTNYKEQMLAYSSKAIILSSDGGEFLYGE